MQQVFELDPSQAEFTELCRRHALSTAWQSPELFVETVQVGPLSIDLAGATTTSLSGRSAFGSAAQLRVTPGRRRGATLSAVARSYYELIERTAIIESCESSAATFAVFDADHQRFAVLPRSVVHPRDEQPKLRRFSVSNGVAAHVSWSSACRSAARELIERDRVLRSWYGAITPEPLELTGHPLALDLGDDYEFFAYGFGHVDVTLECGMPRERVAVAAVFGFPRTAEAPLLAGFGTGSTRDDAVERAWRECTQRLGFLWGESIPTEPPELSPTAEYHQEHYLYAPNHDRLRSWLSGDHRRYAGVLRAVRCDEPEIVFADLTPPSLHGRFSVVKALSAETVPLVFGHGHPWLVGRTPPALAVQPIA